MSEDVEILFPDVDVDVRDPDTGESRTVTVRELRFLDGLHAQAEARELIAALADVVPGAGDGGGEFPLEPVMDALAEHAETWLALIARATGRPADWIGRLAEADGDALGAAMWRANRHFFVRRILRRRKGGASSLPKSSTPSSAPATGADTGTSPGG